MKWNFISKAGLGTKNQNIHCFMCGFDILEASVKVLDLVSKSVTIHLAYGT